jgi:hypothetical protein
LAVDVAAELPCQLLIGPLASITALLAPLLDAKLFSTDQLYGDPMIPVHWHEVESACT